ncbi:hypothetical protein CVT25_002097 [Psilocybe cyanescens]|uniref:Uncharacterized protein n=1 Tax=Psilocybe cyanescens TaxID=93625 RepID=A0A409X9F3_PSICY|nr:hypothetical protein CVT25_002097 [Psilocybe cyanescens]
MGSSLPWTILGPASSALLDGVILILMVIFVILALASATLSRDQNVQTVRVDTAIKADYTDAAPLPSAKPTKPAGRPSSARISRIDSADHTDAARLPSAKSAKPRTVPRPRLILPARKIQGRRYAYKRRPTTSAHWTGTSIRIHSRSTWRWRTLSIKGRPQATALAEPAASKITIRQDVPSRPVELKSRVSIHTGTPRTKAESHQTSLCYGKSSITDDLFSILTFKSRSGFPGLPRLPVFRPNDWINQFRGAFHVPPVVVYMYSRMARYTINKSIEVNDILTENPTSSSSAPLPPAAPATAPRPFVEQIRDQILDLDEDDDDEEEGNRRQGASLPKPSKASAFKFENLEEKEPSANYSKKPETQAVQVTRQPAAQRSEQRAPLTIDDLTEMMRGQGMRQQAPPPQQQQAPPAPSPAQQQQPQPKQQRQPLPPQELAFQLRRHQGHHHQQQPQQQPSQAHWNLPAPKSSSWGTQASESAPKPSSWGTQASELSPWGQSNQWMYQYDEQKVQEMTKKALEPLPVDDEDMDNAKPEKKVNDVPVMEDVRDVGAVPVEIVIVKECDMADLETDEMLIVKDPISAPTPIQGPHPAVPMNSLAPPPAASQFFTLPPAHMDSFFKSFVPRKQQQPQQQQHQGRKAIYQSHGAQTDNLAPHLQPAQLPQLQYQPQIPAYNVVNLNPVVLPVQQHEQEAHKLYDLGVQLCNEIFEYIPRELVHELAYPLAKEALEASKNTIGEELKTYLGNNLMSMLLAKYPVIASHCKLRSVPAFVPTPAPGPAVPQASAAPPAPPAMIPTPSQEPPTPAVERTPKTPPPPEESTNSIGATKNAGHDNTTTDGELYERDQARGRGDALSSSSHSTFPGPVASAGGADHSYWFSCGPSPAIPSPTHAIRLARDGRLKASTHKATASPSPEPPNLYVRVTMPRPESPRKVVEEERLGDDRLKGLDEVKAEIGVNSTAKGSEDRADQPEEVVQDTAAAAATDSENSSLDNELSDQDAEGEPEEDSEEIPLQLPETTLGKRRRSDWDNGDASSERPRKRRRLNDDFEEKDRTRTHLLSVTKAATPIAPPTPSKPAVKRPRHKDLVIGSTSDKAEPRDRSKSRGTKSEVEDGHRRRQKRRQSPSTEPEPEDALRETVKAKAEPPTSTDIAASSSSLGKRRRESDNIDTPTHVFSRARSISPHPLEIAAALKRGSHSHDESDSSESDEEEELPKYTKRARRSPSPSYCPRGTFRAPSPSPPPVYRRWASSPSPPTPILRRAVFSGEKGVRRLPGWLMSIGRFFNRPRSLKLKAATFDAGGVEVRRYRKNSHVYEFEMSSVKEPLVDLDPDSNNGV